MATIASAQNGNWSSTSTWTGGVVPGDGDIVQVGHAVVIDQNLGTNGNGLKRVHIYGASAALTVDTSAARTVYFASTGSDPIGTGSSTAPGTDATAWGFFVARGTLNLTGSAANPVVITSGNDSSPIYIHHHWGDVDFGGVARFNGATITLRYCDIRHCGMNSAQYRGLNIRPESGSPVSVRDCKFSDYYYGYYQESNGATPNSETFQRVHFTGSRSGLTFFFAHATPDNVTIEDCTEDGATASGEFCYFNARPASLEFHENAVIAPSTSIKRTLLRITSGGTALNLDVTNSAVLNQTDNILGPSSPTAGYGLRIGLDDLTDSCVFDGIVAEFCYQSFALSGAGGGIVRNCYSNQGKDSWFSQGNLFVTEGIWKIQNFIGVQDTSASPQGMIGALNYKGASVAPTVTLDHCTFYARFAADGQNSGVYLGEGAAPVINSRMRSCLIGPFNYGIRDGETGGTSTYTVDTPPGAGVHHNGVWGCTNAYADNGGVGFDNGTNQHPHATYGDLSADPQFADPDARYATTWDTSLGGAGTHANLAAEFGKRSGFGGTANANYTVANLLAYLQAGFAVGNSAYRRAGHDLKDMGAVHTPQILVISTAGGQLVLAS